MSRRLAAALALVLIVSACGSSEATTDVATGESTAADADAETAESDHGDEDDDEDHDDHDDEDHDEDHEDHGDDDHDDDEDHDDHDSSGLGAHEHGSAELSVAWIGADIVIDLVSPTENVFGFEYEPETDEDRATATERTEALTAEGIIKVNDAAGCELDSPVSTGTEREGSHAEITVSWQFACANPDEVAELNLSELFAEFPGFQDVDAEWVSETGQSSAELSPTQTTLSLQS